VQFRHYERPIGEAIFGIGGYFSSQLVDGRWRTWFQQPIMPPYGWPGATTGGTITNPYNSGQPGSGWGHQSDEWLKGMQFWEGTGQYEKSICFSCQVNSVIVLTDGVPMFDNSVPVTKMMQLMVAAGAKHPDGTPVTFDPSSPSTNPNPGGINYCDKFEKAPGVMATKADCDYTYYNWPTGHAATNKNFMDDVAFFLANSDLRGDLPGNQSMRTYTIGYGDNSVMLQSISLAGKGAFYRVNNPTEMRDAIKAVLGDVKQVSTSFATANISTVQTGNAQSSVYVPRFVPRKNRPYEGHLYRFFFYNEFAQGCNDTKARSSSGDPYDLNKDKDCDDSFFVDNPSPGSNTVPAATDFTRNNIVQENADGVWVKVATATVGSDGSVQGGTPAVPFWNVGDTVGNRKAKDACDRNNPTGPTSGRCIFTMVDRDKDGKFTSLDNPPEEFVTTNLASLKQHLLAAGDTFCAQLFSRQKKAWTGAAAEQDECARDVIRFIRGQDVLDFDGDNIRDEERPCADNKQPTDTKSCKLADIFHSTPVTVEPPIEPFLCTLGLHPQCASSLYEDFSNSVTSQSLCSSGGAPCYMSTPTEPKRGANGKKYGAYDVFRETYGKRDRIALVGSNGGMLHAIHVGSAPNGATKTDPLDDIHDLGTGQEMWSFIPPDLLPKLGQVFLMHQYFVDGTPMVRDVWADGAVSGTRNGIKEPEEFRTLAVITERSGGQRFTALDVTDPKEMLKADGKPFRWMFPNACAPESSTAGQSWANFAPKPPPIGPVRLKPTVETASSTKRGWEERWVVMLNGGHSPDLSRGRGVYMVDAWSGNTLWSAEARPGPATGDSYKDLLRHMMPVVASPALVDIGKAENVQRDLDGFFDTMIVGDVGGQVWTFRFFEPGEIDSTTGQVNNWVGARSLEMARDDSSVNGPRNLFQKAPITNIASNVLQPETGWLRSYVGTGDRQHLRTTVGTDCGPDDLLACVRMKCNVTATFAADINGVQRSSTIKYENGVLVTNSESWGGSAASVCQASKMDLTALSIDCPDATTIGSGSYTLSTVSTQSSCEPSGGQWSCKQIQLSTGARSNLTLSDADKTLVPKQRYFGFHSYGGWERKFTDAASALKFDKRRLTDTENFNCGTDANGVKINCSLVDVTIPDSDYAEYTRPDGTKAKYLPTAKLNAAKRGTTEGPGWFVKYNPIQERTAAGSTVLAGIVFWPTFAPASGGGGSACSLSGVGDMSNMWQADAITGLPDQADGFRMYNDKGEMLGFSSFKGRATSAPPTDPPPLISLSKSGGIRYEVAVTSPGEAPRTEKLRDQRNVTPDIYWLEVPRNLHECRHENAAACK
jgi:type IV pilus assembly protein PilY1